MLAQFSESAAKNRDFQTRAAMKRIPVYTCNFPTSSIVTAAAERQKRNVSN